MICALAITLSLLLRLHRPTPVERPGARYVAAMLADTSWRAPYVNAYRARDEIAEVRSGAAIAQTHRRLRQRPGTRPADPRAWWRSPRIPAPTLVNLPWLDRLPTMGQPIPELVGAA